MQGLLNTVENAGQVVHKKSHLIVHIVNRNINQIAIDKCKIFPDMTR